MTFFWITIETRNEKTETLKQIIDTLKIWSEEKDLYILSLEILNDHDFSIFFETIISQINLWNNNTKEYSIEPLTSQII